MEIIIFQLTIDNNTMATPFDIIGNEKNEVRYSPNMKIKPVNVRVLYARNHMKKLRTRQ